MPKVSDAAYHDVMAAFPWDSGEPLSRRAALALQLELRDRVRTADRVGEVRLVAGVDVAYPRGGRTARGAAVLLDSATLTLQESATAEEPVRFPYVPGLLTFREAPAALAALRRLSIPPDLVLVDGHGVAHPRRFGLACFLGLELAVPTIGVGKSLLVGEHPELPAERGARRPIVHEGEVIGAVVRTRAGVRPVYVSVGHLVTLETAILWVLRCSPRYRLPEPLRGADALSRRAW